MSFEIFTPIWSHVNGNGKNVKKKKNNNKKIKIKFEKEKKFWIYGGHIVFPVLIC